MTVKLLTEHQLELLSLIGSCTGLSESTLVKMPHCWKAHATAQILLKYTMLGHLQNIRASMVRVILICLSSNFSTCKTKLILSYDVTSGSEITPCNKICKPLVVYRFTGNVMTSI